MVAHTLRANHCVVGNPQARRWKIALKLAAGGRERLRELFEDAACVERRWGNQEAGWQRKLVLSSATGSAILDSGKNKHKAPHTGRQSMCPDLM
jgi:hypothetical protein